MRLIVLLMYAVFACACARVPPTPEADDAPDAARLVVLSPALTIMLADVGAQHLIVGRHDFDLTLRHLPAAGHQGAIDYEMLLLLQPTHVLIEWGERALPTRLVALSAQHNWELEHVTLLTLDDISRVADDMHTRFGAKPESEPPSAVLARALEPRRPSLVGVGRVLLLGTLDPPAALGPGSWHHQMLLRLGATPAIEHGTPWIELDREDLLTLAPDVIVLMMPREGGMGIGATGADAVSQLGTIATLRLPAIENSRVAVLDGPLYLTPSTAMTACARDLASVLGAWAEAEEAD
ncbi:MAG: hypothetical protein KF757_11305 [Phycisphaeraceae bacterium]|nr:hypothetical protein [Phycisphaeraceae bacterium]MCW5762273.1 hypothetical protein [Phycisphaeraceae bacterium]